MLFLLGREPEAPSDALTTGDMLLLDEWVKRGGIAVLGYAGDGEGSLDRSTVNQWLASEGAGIAISDRLLEDTAQHGGAPRVEAWVEGRQLGDHPLGAIYGSFPLERNHVLEVKRASGVLAVAPGPAYARGRNSLESARDAPVVAATRIGDGLVVVISRYALGCLGAQERPPRTPLLQLDALTDTRAFLTALARWARRPAEWAHVPPAAGHGSQALVGPSDAELQAGRAEPPEGGSTTVALPLPAPARTATATGIPEWIRDVGLRALWTPLFVARGTSELPRTTTALDSLVSSLDQGGFNLLAGEVNAEVVADSMHHFWEERAAVRRAWHDAVTVLQPTSVAWVPALDYRRITRARPDSTRGGNGAPTPACILDSLLWETKLTPGFITIGRLAAGLRDLVPAVALDVDSVPTAPSTSVAVGSEYCDAAWRHVLARMPPPSVPLRDSIAAPDRLRALREAGLLASYYATLEELVVARARTLRDRVLRERPGLYFAFRLRRAPGDWLSLALLRGFTVPERPLLLFTPEAQTRNLLALYRERGINAVHAVQISPAVAHSRNLPALRHVVYVENDGFWLAGLARTRGDSLAQVLRRLAR